MTVVVLASASASGANGCGTSRDPDGARTEVRIFNGKPTCAKAKWTLRSYALAIKSDEEEEA